MADPKGETGFGIVLQKSEKLLFYISSTATAAMMLLISLDALSRYLFNYPISGAYEVNQDFLMVAIVFFSLSYTYAHGDHVNVDTFVKFIPAPLLRPMNFVFRLLALIFVALLVYASWSKTAGAIQQREYASGNVVYPLALAYILVPFGSAVFLLRLIYEFFSKEPAGPSEEQKEEPIL